MKRSRKPQMLSFLALEARDVPAALDPTFGDNGTAVLGNYDSVVPSDYVVTNIGQYLTLSHADDRTGAPEDPIQMLNVVRLTNAGSLDNTFDNDGLLNLNALLETKLPVLPENSQGYFAQPTSGLLSAPDGKWLLSTLYIVYESDEETGETVSSQSTQLVVRLLNDGRVDTSFGDDGIVAQTIESNSYDIDFNSPSVGSDGSIYLVSSPYRNDESGTYPVNFAITKLTPAGVLDTDFGTDGQVKVTTNLEVIDYSVFSPTLSVLSDGSFLATGLVSVPEGEGSVTRAVVVKVNADGTQDLSYGANGVVDFTSISGLYGTIANPAFGAPDGIAGEPETYPVGVGYQSKFTPQADGTVLGVLIPESGIQRNLPLGYAFKLNADGSFDDSFGGDGVVEVDSPYYLDFGFHSVASIQLLPTEDDGYLLASVTGSGFTLQKLTSTGATDTTFGQEGFAVLSNPSDEDENDQDRRNYFSYSDSPFTLNGDELIVSGTLQDNQIEIALTRIDLAAATPALPEEPTFNPDGPIFLNMTTDGEAPGEGDGEVPADGDGEAPSRPNEPGENERNNPPVSPPTITITAQRPETREGFGQMVIDFDGDGVTDTIQYAQAAEGGSVSTFSIISGATGEAIVSDFQPYEDAYNGGLIITVGDLNSDGTAEVVVAPDVGGSARIQIFQLVDGNLVQVDNFFGIEDVDFRGGARVALGDFNGDGKLDLTVSAGPGGGPRIAIFDGEQLGERDDNPRKLMGDFFAYSDENDLNLRNGVTIATSDIDGDGVRDLVIGAGEGGAPRLTILSGSRLFNMGAEEAIDNPIEDMFLNDDSDSRDGVSLVLSEDDLGEIIAINRSNGVRTTITRR